VKLTTPLKPTPSNVTSDPHTPGMFWKIGAEFHGNEAVRSDATDFILFSVMGILCAWPIVSVIVAISRTLNGY
jgi:hypothetical protein